MRLLGSKYPKRSVIWGNTQKIWRFKTGQLKTRKSKKSMLVKRYRDQRGRSRFVGKTKALKHSACLDCVIPLPVTKTIIVDICVPATAILTLDSVLCFLRDCLWDLRCYPLGFGLRYLSMFEDLQQRNFDLKDPCEAPRDQSELRFRTQNGLLSFLPLRMGLLIPS